MLLRCVCKTVRECILSDTDVPSSDRNVSANSRRCVQSSKLRAQSALPPMRLLPVGATASQHHHVLTRMLDGVSRRVVVVDGAEGRRLWYGVAASGG